MRRALCFNVAMYGAAACFSACAVGSTTTDAELDSDAGPDDGSVSDRAPPRDAGQGTDSAEPVDSAAPDTASADTGTPPSDTGVDSPPVESGACTTPFAGAIVTYDLSAEPGGEASAAAKSSAPGVTAGALTRSAGLTAVAGSGSINSSGWLFVESPLLYYTLTVTAPAGCTLSLASLALDLKASSSGPAFGDVATSVDAFAAHRGTFGAST